MSRNDVERKTFWEENGLDKMTEEDRRGWLASNQPWNNHELPYGKRMYLWNKFQRIVKGKLDEKRSR